MTRDNGRHAERGDAKQAPSEGCQSGPKASPEHRSSPSIDEELIEDAEKTVYASMQWAARHRENGEPPNWVERGNSLAQAEARGAARSITASLLSDRAKLDAECERAWNSYRIAHGQAMANGEALANERADRAKLEERVREAMTWIEAPFVMPDTSVDELRKRIGFMLEDIEKALNRSTDR